MEEPRARGTVVNQEPSIPGVGWILPQIVEDFLLPSSIYIDDALEILGKADERWSDQTAP